MLRSLNNFEFGSRRGFPDPTEEEAADSIQQDSSILSNTLRAARLPQLNVSVAETLLTFDRQPSFHTDLDFSTLVAVRRAHETQRAVSSVRTQGTEGKTKLTHGKEPTVRQKILHEMNQVLREDQDKRMNTGANRLATWTSSAPGGHRAKDVAVLAGNSANAELAAGQRAVTVSCHIFLCPLSNNLC